MARCSSPNVVRLRGELMHQSEFDVENRVFRLCTMLKDPIKSRFKLDKIRIFYAGKPPTRYNEVKQQVEFRVVDHDGADCSKGTGKQRRICMPSDFIGRIVDVWCAVEPWRYPTMATDEYGGQHEVLTMGWRLKLMRMRGVGG
jgi:hypothetical protein